MIHRTRSSIAKPISGHVMMNYANYVMVQVQMTVLDVLRVWIWWSPRMGIVSNASVVKELFSRMDFALGLFMLPLKRVLTQETLDPLKIQSSI